MESHKVVSREEWLAARKEHLTKEKEFTRVRDQLSQQRRELPWEKVDKNVCVRRTKREGITCLICSPGAANSLSITSCLTHSGRKGAKVAHFGPTTLTMPSFISTNVT